MSTAPSQSIATGFAAGMTLFAIVAMLLTAVLPLWMSMAIVFLFAGPHNYVEARYFLTRLPARLGRLRGFFMFSAVGIVSLTVAFPLLIRIPAWLQWSPRSAVWLVGAWNTALILWVTRLVSLRSVQPPRRQWDYAWPLGFAAVGISWLNPLLLPLCMVYLHPLAGLWVLDREIASRRPGWQTNYRRWMLLVPLLIVVLWGGISVGAGQSSYVSNSVSDQIARHSGAAWCSPGVGQRLIATHAFLELLHYGIWIVVIPLASGRVFASGFTTVPLMRRSLPIRRVLRVGLALSALVVVILWVCFALDYRTTRDVYFTVATLHVLAEIPFLLRLL